MYIVSVLPGDGIGPEVVREARKVLQIIEKRYHLSLDYRYADVGGVAIDQHGHALPESTLRQCLESDAVLFGSVGGPKWEGLPPDQQPERAALLALRKHLHLYANLRPAVIHPSCAHLSPLRKDIASRGCDLIVLRELSSGIYFGTPKQQDEYHGVDTMYYHREEIERIADLAFRIAKDRNKKICSVDKANVLSSMVLWRKTIEKIGTYYPEVHLTHMYVDNAAMQLIRDPSQFDVILCGNLFGDILSDEAAAIAGSLGLLPSASLSAQIKGPSGNLVGLFEPAGGSAPDIAGKGIANPIAQILSAAMMLEFSLQCPEGSKDIHKAVYAVLEKGHRTQDITSSQDKAINTTMMGEAIVKELESQ